MVATLPAFDYAWLPSIRGRTRRVYMDTEWVYKVARNVEGAISNVREAKHYQFNKSHPDKMFIPLAECYLLDDGALKMRRVEECDLPWDELPDWVGYVDCAQVGYVEGELVAFNL